MEISKDNTLSEWSGEINDDDTAELIANNVRNTTQNTNGILNVPWRNIFDMFGKTFRLQMK